MREYWYWFLRLNKHGRPPGMGPSEILYSQMLSFFELIGVVPEPYEIEVIEAFDSIAMKHFAEQQEKESKKAKQKAK